jgi:hypothetical protein
MTQQPADPSGMQALPTGRTEYTTTQDLWVQSTLPRVLPILTEGSGLKACHLAPVPALLTNPVFIP